MDGGDGDDWEFYRIGLSKELIAGFAVDLSYYVNSEEDYVEAFYGGEDVAGSTPGVHALKGILTTRKRCIAFRRPPSFRGAQRPSTAP
jgi:hypothetical protein